MRILQSITKEDMDSQYWFNIWADHDIKFHQAKVNSHLIKFFELAKPGVVFVPLCGKSLDMEWLAQQGYRVVGVELSAVACREFFEEQKRSFHETTQGEFRVFQSGAITLWCGDFFSLPKEAVKGVTGFYDRAALIALPAEVRKKYVEYLLSLLDESPKKEFRALLLAIHYPQELVDGPPFSVDEKEIRKLWGTDYHIEKVLELEDLHVKKFVPKFAEVPEIKESVYRLTKLTK